MAKKCKYNPTKEERKRAKKLGKEVERQRILFLKYLDFDIKKDTLPASK